MLTPTTPVAQPALITFVITSVSIQIEPTIFVIVQYAPSDASGNPIGPVTSVPLGAAALMTMQSTAGGFKAKLYAALQTQIPALVGVVT